MAFENLKLSISNLWDEFGATDRPVLGVVINLSLAIVGLIAFELVSNPWLEVIAMAWIALNMWGIISWVMLR